MLTVRFDNVRPQRERFDFPVALVLGGFDGLHIGHRHLLAEAQKTGLPVALTTMFGGKGKVLFTQKERREIFERAGVSCLCEIDLDGTLRKLSAEDFCGTVFSLFDVRAAFCGEDFRFGRDALGTPALLKRLAPCPVTVCKTVKYRFGDSGRGRKFSASACKRFLKAGDISALNACHFAKNGDFYDGAYFIKGEVEHGRQVGRTYGFPTLNLSVPAEKLLPPDGVYGGLCRTPKGNFPTIVNIGSRPTFGIGERKIEAYLDGFSGDLYGADVAVYPTEFYRGIEKFASAEDLKSQLQRDIARLRTRRLL